MKTLAEKLGESSFTIATSSHENGSPHIEVDGAYHFIVRERGLEISRKQTDDLDELLYWIFEGLTARMSWDFELQHRRPFEDSRRQAFTKQLELLASLSSEWAVRQRLEQEDILRLHPFRDG
ncbi:Imm63 family immunity protein [Sphingomonas sp. ASV193]|uniref:Imm63 family immunity protein n=1 Tax=Sphingomonas sp. ASV193 TaxID=3144405 RepID=UPI0032E92BFE